MERFTLNTAFYEPIKGLSDKQLGRLFRAIFEYQICGSTEVDSDISIAFGFFKSQFDMEGAKRMRIAERNRQNGQNGGRPKAGKNAKGEETQKTQWVIEKPKKPSGFSTPFVPPISPEPPLYPPISPSSSTTTISAHAREWEGGDLKIAPYGQDPKEKSCGQKESPLPSGTWVASEDLADRLLADLRWVQAVAKNKGHTEDEVRILVREFCTNVELTEDGKEVSDAKRHFINWLRKKTQNNGTHTQRSTTSTQQRGVGGSMQSHLEAVRRAVAEGVATAATLQEWQ